MGQVANLKSRMFRRGMRHIVFGVLSTGRTCSEIAITKTSKDIEEFILSMPVSLRYSLGNRAK